MAHIKEIKVNAIIYNPICRYHAWTHRTFKTFTDDNGNKTYYIDGKQVSKEDGNKNYVSMKKANAEYQQTKDCKDYIKREWKGFYWAKKNGRDTKLYTLHEADTFKQEVVEYEISYEEIIDRLEGSIDQYVEYIDNGRQYREACDRNASIRDEIRRMEKLIAERK